MSAPFLTVHTKFYRLKFIQDNNLYLNEDVPNAEDVLYNTGAIGLADRILILPQFIGYCYYQHVGSTCQTYKRSNEQILQLATSATLACEQGWKYGVYIDDVALSLFGACNLTILASDTDYETVKKASDIAKPYLDKLHKPIVTKFSDEKTIKRITSLANLVFRHPRLTMLVKKILKARNIDFEKMAKERN